MPLVATRGAASAQGFGEFARVTPPIYIEDVFSTYLYTGTGSSQTITNGIDLSGKGGLVWVKSRSVNNNCLVDTVRGASNTLQSDLTTANVFASTVTAFSSSGFTVGTSGLVSNSNSYASWTFREQPKFFDIVTYTGDGASSKSVSHNLGSTPGCVIVKRTDSTSFWLVWHRGFSSPSVSYGYLNSTDPFQPDSPNNNWAAAPTSTTFTPASNYNVNGATYVAYLFAHDAGGFGSAGTDNVISCGGFTVSGGATTTVNLGYEPQWLLIKRVDTTGNWQIFDSMRGFTVSFNNSAILMPNLPDAEIAPGGTARVLVTSTGFQYNPAAAADQMIYIAIRRGPMKTPTTGTSVFTPSTRAGTGASVTTSNLSFPPDAVWSKGRDNGGTNSGAFDRLRGATKQLSLNQTDAETTASTSLTGFDVMTGYTAGADAVQLTINATGYNYVNWQFRRAPGFFDVVCFTTDGSTNQRVTHNLAVVPELIITKRRDASGSWFTYSATLGRSGYVSVNLTNANFTGFSDVWGTTNPTSTDFGYNCQLLTNSPYTGRTIVCYLFATCPGVSKVGSYTGTGALQTVNCGFTSGARFVLIKRTDTTGDWWVYDSARGISSGNDPYLFMNSTAAEVTNTNYVDTTSVGFQVTAAAPAGLNANGGTYIFLAIA